ncbi:hypothetical protein [Microterricola viridarii]|uniref:MftR C-terminal domain-containing protein n=1 Tax=Microterricola viridarii TaxID=412690 RepID=A0A0X8E4C1_9MICO|nr:hypothetical protein [Microterricola viridarii]AMB58821.1 hypothetical protein AWU67_08025 [Microterricola viridarii]
MNDLFVQALSESTRDVVRAERADLDEDGVRIASDFLGAGTARVVTDWLERPGETSREQVIEVLFLMLPTWLTQDDVGTH